MQAGSAFYLSRFSIMRTACRNTQNLNFITKLLVGSEAVPFLKCCEGFAFGGLQAFGGDHDCPPVAAA